ncbi:Nucleolar GTPase ATPase p130 protein [Rutstroemia sp. NJR-2017a BBW]|nr:Nucleolar GTPase ATPase p130 protein [Rutstroemia sp. NJR-2017a BBW]
MDPTTNRDPVQPARRLSHGKRPNRLLLTRAASTAGRYASAIIEKSSPDQATYKSQETSNSQRQSIVSFKLPSPMALDSPSQNDSLLTIKPPSNSGRNSPLFNTWIFRSPSIISRTTPNSRVPSPRLRPRTGRETPFSQRQCDSRGKKEVEEQYRPYNPPFERSVDILFTDDKETIDSDTVFEEVLPPRARATFSKIFELPVCIRRRIYFYCFPGEDRKISLSPRFATKDCFSDDYFASPWDVLEPVKGAISSSAIVRNELMTYFWTKYHFHVTLSPFSGPIFSPLSHVWLHSYLDRIQYLTIETDFTRFGCSALRSARQFGYDMKKMENLLGGIVSGLLKRNGLSTMAELHLICRRFKGNHPRDEKEPWTWSNGDLNEYCPEETMWLCDAVINLRGILKSARLSGFRMDYTETLLQSIFGEGNDSPGWIVPIASAWPPLPPQQNMFANQNIKIATPISMSPIDTCNSASASSETLRSRLTHESSFYSHRRVNCSEELSPLTHCPSQPGTSQSSLVEEHVRKYHDTLPPLTSSDTSGDTDRDERDSIKTPKCSTPMDHDEKNMVSGSGDTGIIKDQDPQEIGQYKPSLLSRQSGKQKVSKSRLPRRTDAQNRNLTAASSSLTDVDHQLTPHKTSKSSSKTSSPCDNDHTPSVVQNRKLLTPSPSAQFSSICTNSPNTQNRLNEQDPAYLRSLEALRSVSASGASEILSPTPVARDSTKNGGSLPSSMTHWANMNIEFMRTPDISFTSMGMGAGADQGMGMDRDQERGDTQGVGRRYLRFIDRLRGRKSE